MPIERWDVAETPTLDEVKQMILERIRRERDISFAGLMNLGEWTAGDLAWELMPNLVLWSGMSQLLADALMSLRDQIEPHSCHVLVYLADGMAMGLPQAKLVREYKKPHWLPVIFVLRDGCKKLK